MALRISMEEERARQVQPPAAQPEAAPLAAPVVPVEEALDEDEILQRALQLSVAEGAEAAKPTEPEPAQQANINELLQDNDFIKDIAMDLGIDIDEDPAKKEEEQKKKELQREFGTMEVARCFLVNEQNEPYSFDFVVESVGPLSPNYIVARAIQVIQEKVTKYASVDVGDLPENVKVFPADARMKGFDFHFEGEDHTLGNLLQVWIDANHMDSGEATFVGYKVPHPLKDEMVLRIGVESGTEDDARKVLMKAARGISQMFKGWGENWATASGGAVSQSVGSAFRARRAV